MSTGYYIICEKCKKKLHIGQYGCYVYDTALNDLRAFFKQHELHELIYTSEHFCSEPEQGYKEVRHMKTREETKEGLDQGSQGG